MRAGLRDSTKVPKFLNPNCSRTRTHTVEKRRTRNMSPETFLYVLNVGLSPECQRSGFTFKTFPMLLATTASNVPKKVHGWISEYTNLSPQVDSDAALAWNLLKEKQDHLKPLCHAHFAVNDLKHSKALVKCFSFCTFGDAFPICEKKRCILSGCFRTGAYFSS